MQLASRLYRALSRCYLQARAWTSRPGPPWLPKASPIDPSRTPQTSLCIVFGDLGPPRPPKDPPKDLPETSPLDAPKIAKTSLCIVSGELFQVQGPPSLVAGFAFGSVPRMKNGSPGTLLKGTLSQTRNGPQSSCGSRMGPAWVRNRVLKRHPKRCHPETPNWSHMGPSKGATIPKVPPEAYLIN